MQDKAKRHPFLDDLHEDVILVTSVLNRPVRGKTEVLKVVKAGAQQYASQSARFLDHVGQRSFFEYDATLTDGQAARGLVSIERNASGKVTELHIAFSPLAAVYSLADSVRQILRDEIDPGFFVER